MEIIINVKSNELGSEYDWDSSVESDWLNEQDD